MKVQTNHLYNRVVKILKEDEFKESLEIMQKGMFDELARHIADNIIIDKISNEELRAEIRLYFENYYEDDIETGNTTKKENSSGAIIDFSNYNEYMDRFLILFEQLDLPTDQRQELHNSVASINNYGAYLITLCRCLSDAIYNSVDLATANIIMANAVQTMNDNAKEHMREFKQQMQREDNKGNIEAGSLGEYAKSESNVINFKTNK